MDKQNAANQHCRPHRLSVYAAVYDAAEIPAQTYATATLTGSLQERLKQTPVHNNLDPGTHGHRGKRDGRYTMPTSYQ